MTESPRESVQEVSEPVLLRFRIIHLIYVITLLAAALATFGPDGLLPGISVIGFWAFVFVHRSRPRCLLSATLFVLLCACPLGLVLPGLHHGPQTGHRLRCNNNLRQIAFALHHYYADYDSFPPAYTVDVEGKPMHSWRTLILPYLDEQSLYDQYDFDEPWNGPNNQQLVSQMPRVYSCPSTDSWPTQTFTSYVAVVGQDTAWPGSASLSPEEIPDSLSHTGLIVELSGQDLPWLAPHDPKLADALNLMASGPAEAAGTHESEDFFHRYYPGRFLTFADGSVRFVGHGLRKEHWSAILETDSGTSWSEEELLTHMTGAKQLRLGNCFRLSVLVLVTLLPLPWMWLNPHSNGP